MKLQRFDPSSREIFPDFLILDAFIPLSPFKMLPMSP